MNRSMKVARVNPLTEFSRPGAMSNGSQKRNGGGGGSGSRKDVQVVFGKQPDQNQCDERKNRKMPITHPLNSTWTLWYYYNPKRVVKKENWSNFHREVMSFSDVETFWYIVDHHVTNPSELTTGASYYLFKNGIKPEWEDPANKNGGRWLIHFDTKKHRRQLHLLWLEVMMCLIGECIDELEEVCGCVVDTRMKADKISIWTSHWKNDQKNLAIGRYIQQSLEKIYGERVLMKYEKHDYQGPLVLQL